MLRLVLLFVLVFSSPFSIVVTPLGEERAGLCGSRAFIYFERVGVCLSSLPLSVRGWTFLLTLCRTNYMYNITESTFSRVGPGA